MNELIIYGDIGPDYWGDGITDTWVKEQLNGMSGDITVRINSVGGDVFHGHTIHNLLKEYPSNVTVKVDGLAASAASVIAMAGNKVHLADNAMLMIHNPWTFALGDSQEMLKVSARLDKVKDAIVTTYANRTGIEEAEISELMDAETWLTAKESIEKGFADEQTEEESKVLNMSKPWVKNAPDIEKPREHIHEHPEQVTPFKIAAKSRLLDIC